MQMRRCPLIFVVALSLLYPISCVTQDSTGTPAQAAFGHMEMWVQGSDTGYALKASIRLQGSQATTLETDAAGRATLQLPAGEYAVVISAPGYKTMKLALDLAPVANQNRHINLDPEKAPEGESPESIEAHIRPGYTVLHGFVIDADTRKPLPGVTVRLGKAQGRTDAKGHYFVSVSTPPMTATGPGALTLAFAKPGYHTIVIENFKVASDQLREVPIDMESGHGEIREVAPEPGGSTGPMDPNAKGETGLWSVQRVHSLRNRPIESSATDRLSYQLELCFYLCHAGLVSGR